MPSRRLTAAAARRDATDADVYTGYRGVANTTVAKFSPSGYYIACGSTGGWLNIVASKRNDEGDFIEKAKYEVLSGPVKDIAWSMDNQRCLVVGDGKDSFTRALIVDSGATVGDLGGHSGRVQSVDFKPSRPFRAVTGSEDQKTNFYAGPPFKFGHSTEVHTGNVNCVRYSHKGALYCTVGSDKQGFLFDGKEGKQVGVMGPEGMHTATVYTCSWSPDDSMILTTSADKTAKVWAVGEDNNATLVSTFAFQDPKNRLNMMVGGVWADSCLVTANLNGDIFQLQQGQPEPSAVFRGHKDYISGMAINAANGELVCCDGGGRILSWDVPTANGTEIKGDAKQTPKIFTCCAVSPGAPIAFCGTGDNKLLLANLTDKTLGAAVELPKVCREVQCSPAAPGAAYCITSEALHVLAAADGTAALSIVASYPIDEPTALAVSPGAHQPSSSILSASFFETVRVLLGRRRVRRGGHAGRRRSRRRQADHLPRHRRLRRHRRRRGVGVAPRGGGDLHCVLGGWGADGQLGQALGRRQHRPLCVHAPTCPFACLSRRACAVASTQDRQARS